MDNPSPIFEDVTMKIDEFNNKINTGKLPDLAEACNKYMIPLVMCPWGESVFLHKCQYIPYDITI